MHNFQHVGKAALSYRLIPRIFGIFFLAVLIGVAAYFGLSFFQIANFTTISMGAAAVFFVLIALFSYFAAYLEYSNLQYVIEENSLLLKQGVFNVDTETIPYQKIRNASFTQNFVQRLYGVGNVIIDQDPETYIWQSIDNATAQTIIEAVSEKSNIQPIAVAPNQPNPYTPQPPPTQQ